MKQMTDSAAERRVVARVAAARIMVEVAARLIDWRRGAAFSVADTYRIIW